MKLASTLFVILPAVTNTFAATITVFDVKVPATTTISLPSVFPTPLISIYPIGTGANGETTYVEDIVGSVTGEIDYTVATVNGVVTRTPYTTIIDTINPLTRHATIVADSTHFSYIEDPISTIGVSYGQKEDCVLDGTTGSCVEEVMVVDAYSSTFIRTTTWTGSVVPAFTVVESNAASTTSAQPNGSTSRSRLLNEARVGLGIVMVGVLSGWFLVH